VISNRQKCVPLTIHFLRPFVKQLTSLLRLGRRRFDVTLVDDEEIERLNHTFRRMAQPTDVLSFPWRNTPEGERELSPMERRLSGFLGDIVISVETAQRNSIATDVSLRLEIRQLVLHGVLHLLGYNHEIDHGEMAALEISLRRKLGIDG
jgi:probable rRNA maturation factor